MSVLALLGCQGQAPAQGRPAPAPAGVVVTDGAGKVVATLRAGHPCRAEIGPIELIVGGPPLVAQLGQTRWAGEDHENGTMLSRDGTPTARVFTPSPGLVAVFDPKGVPELRITASKDAASVSGAAGRRVRTLSHAGKAIAVSAPALTVTGTDDLALAALLTAPELAPEVRMMAACQRVLGGSH